MNTILENTVTLNNIITGTKKRILFANIPADGHFNPLTGLATHLKSIGHDVRWYTGPSYADKIKKLGIPAILFKKAKEVTVHNIDEVFPERKKIKNHVKKISFDICTYFIMRGPEFYEDLQDIHKDFPFDVLIADNGFTGITFTRAKMDIPVIMVNVTTLYETSKDLAPTVMGMTPAKTWLGKRVQDVLRYLTDNVLLSAPNKLMRSLHKQYGVDTGNKNIFDAQVSMASVVLQSGTPGFEYHRSDMSKHIHFAGPLLPKQNSANKPLAFEDKLLKYNKVLLVSQGTFEGDVTKLIIPAIEAYKNTDYLLLVATAGWETKALRKKYPHDNVIIEDYIPYSQVMPYADVFIMNGGYGSAMLSISNHLPMVAGGLHEGKNEICARIGYFKLGINLRTERPKPAQIKKAVDEVMHNNVYYKNTVRLSEEFKSYDSALVCEKFVDKLTAVKKQ